MPHRPALAALFILALLAAPAAAQPGTPACKRELADAQKKMDQSLALVSTTVKMAPKDRCPNYFKAQELVSEIRRNFERCAPDAEHARALRNADDVEDALDTVDQQALPALARHDPHQRDLHQAARRKRSAEGIAARA